MQWRLSPLYLAWAVSLFVLLVLLATVGAGWGWVRSFLGDVMAVAWVYCVFRAFSAAGVLPLASAALGVGLLVELGQYLASTFQLHIPNRALRIVLGSTADWWDVLAYALGFAAVLAAESVLRSGSPRAATP